MHCDTGHPVYENPIYGLLHEVCSYLEPMQARTCSLSKKFSGSLKMTITGILPTPTLPTDEDLVAMTCLWWVPIWGRGGVVMMSRDSKPTF